VKTQAVGKKQSNKGRKPPEAQSSDEENDLVKDEVNIKTRVGKKQTKRRKDEVKKKIQVREKKTKRKKKSPKQKFRRKIRKNKR
jgi:hypothetical protein